MCHGSGNYSWWKQEINDPITTQCIYGEDIYNTIYNPNEDCYLIQYVYVYVRIEHERNYHCRTKFLRVWVDHLMLVVNVATLH